MGGLKNNNITFGDLMSNFLFSFPRKIEEMFFGKLIIFLRNIYIIFFFFGQKDMDDLERVFSFGERFRKSLWMPKYTVG